MKSSIKILIIFLVINCQLSTVNYAQVGINTDGSNPDASAIMDIKSTTKGMLVPRMTTTQRTSISSPATSLLVFDTTTESFWFRTSATWLELKGASIATSLQDADNDTKIQVEESADEDKIRFTVDGKEALHIDSLGNIGIGKEPSSKLDIEVGYGSESQVINISYSPNFNSFTNNPWQSFTMPCNCVVTKLRVTYSTTGSASNANNNGTLNIYEGTGTGGNLIYTTSNSTVSGPHVTFTIDNLSLDDNAVYTFQATGSVRLNPVALYEGGISSASNTDVVFGLFTKPINSVQFTDNGLILNKYTLPYTDGTTGQILQTDGSGSLAWTTLTNTDNQALSLATDTLTLVNGGSVDLSAYANENTTLIQDADNDTKIQAERNPDEDIIRFDLGGNEKFVFEKNANGDPLLIFGRKSVNTNLNSIFIGNSTTGEVNTGDRNIAVGAGNLRYNTTGFGNVALGPLGLYFNTTGDRNVAVGNAALVKNTTGDKNVGIGDSPLISNTTGHRNVGLGHQALYLNTTGNSNIGLGSNAGFYNETGQNNILLGSFAGKGTANHSKNNNVMIGYEAGEANEGDANVFLGHQAGYSETGDNKLYITNTLTTSPLIYGEFDNALLRVNGTLNVNNAFSFPTADGITGQVLKTDGSGTLSWTNASSINFLQDADNDTKIQVEENADEDIIRFDLEGTELLRLTKNSNGVAQLEVLNNNTNLFIGENAGDNQQLSVSPELLNTGIGHDALRNNTSGFYNTSLGASSLAANNQGHSNVGIGSQAGAFNQNGVQNTFIGHLAGAGFTIHDKSNNVMVGFEAGRLNKGDGNIFLGRSSGYNETGSNKLYIENSSSVTPLIYGEFDNDLLRINGTLNINNAFSFPTADGTNGEILQTDGSGNLAWSDVSKISKDNGWSAIANNSSLAIKSSLFFERFNFSNSGLTIKAEYNGDFGDAQIFKFQSGSNINQISNHFPAISGVATQPTDSDYRMAFSVKGSEVLELTAAGEVTINENYTLPTTDGAPDEVLVTDGSGNTSWKNVGVPIGTIQMWPTGAAPEGWIICNGATFTASDFPDLATVLGSTTLPNFNGRMPLGVGQSSENGATNHALKQTGGEETHTLTVNEMPSHSHDIKYREGDENGSGNDYSDLGGTGVTDATESKGGGAAHNNMPPYYTLYFIIKAK